MMRSVILTVFIFSLLSCTSSNNAPDVSDIKVDLGLERFEQEFFKTDTADLVTGLSRTNKAFPRFYPLFMDEILLLKGAHSIQPDGTVNISSDAAAVLKNFLGAYKPIYDSIQEKYNNMESVKNDMEKGFRYVKYYYTEYKIPRLLTFIGSFDAPGAILTPNYVGIGLHQYAGKNFSVYRSPQLMELYPEYISRRFDKEYIVVNGIKVIVDDIYPDRSMGRPLIEQMIEKGKQWYLLDHFLPSVHDTLKTGYTKKQLDWVESNEGNVWGFFSKNTDLYSINIETIQDFLGEAPSTRVMTDAAPGNIGQWIGWRIVEAYAEKNPNMSLQQVLAVPATTIFQEARYKPK